MAEKQMEKKNYLTYVLVGLLVVAAFISGQLYNRVKSLEQQAATSGKQVAGQQDPTPVKVELKVYDTDPFLGEKNAEVTLVVFEDYQCPFCGAFSGLNLDLVKVMQTRDATWQPTENNFIQDYVKSGKAKLVFKDYPFLDQYSPEKESRMSATAARCAGEQGKFWEYHDYLFSQQKGENEGTFSKDNLKKFAVALGLKSSDFDSCLDSGKYDKGLDEAVLYGQSVGVNGTPAVFVNGKLIPGGAVSYLVVKQAVDAALK